MPTVNEAFDKFKSKLEISPTEQNDASRRQKEVREIIARSFDIKRDFLTGSYGRDTKTKPLKDVDIFFVLGSKDAAWRNKPARETLDAFENCLVAEYGSEKVTRGRRAITVEFDKASPTVSEDGKVFSVDAVPAFEKGNDYEIPDDTLNDWIKSNPEKHAEKATNKNKALDGKWKPLVKMMKAWNRANGKPIKPSFLIEVMALDLIVPPCDSYKYEVPQLFSALHGGVNKDWPDPAGLGPPVSDQMDLFKRAEAERQLRAAELKANQALRAEDQGRIGEALDLWAEIFGRYFPKS